MPYWKLHPQTIRYRMEQVKELLGDSLRDPQRVLAITIALADQAIPTAETTSPCILTDLLRRGIPRLCSSSARPKRFHELAGHCVRV